MWKTDSLDMSKVAKCWVELGKKISTHTMMELESQTALEHDVANNNKIIELTPEEDKIKCIRPREHFVVKNDSKIHQIPHCGKQC